MLISYEYNLFISCHIGKEHFYIHSLRPFPKTQYVLPSMEVQTVAPGKNWRGL